jgi:hypothetical protein
MIHILFINKDIMKFDWIRLLFLNVSNFYLIEGEMSCLTVAVRYQCFELLFTMVKTGSERQRIYT